MTLKAAVGRSPGETQKVTRKRFASPKTVKRSSLLMLLIAMSVPFLYPLVFLVGLAVKTRSNYVEEPTGVIPKQVTLDHLETAWRGGALTGPLLNSTYAVLVGVVTCILCAVPAAYWIHINRGRLSGMVQAFLVGLMSFPLIAMIIPLFIVLSTYDLINQIWVLGVVYGTINTPFAVYLLQSYFRTGLDGAVLEAATIDGAGTYSTLWWVVLPIARPAIGTLAALTFIWTWADIMLAAVLLQDPDHITVMMAISQMAQRRESYDVQLGAAAALIALVPVLIVFAVAQRSIINGFAGGAVK